MRFVTWLATTAAAVAVAALLLDGISFEGPDSGTEELREKVLPLLAVALIQGGITVFVKPLLKLLSFPLIILTLGLFLLVINAAVLRLTGFVAGELDLGFTVTGWWPAIGGAIIITLTTWALDAVLDDD
jgi:putative membrane protein